MSSQGDTSVAFETQENKKEEKKRSILLQSAYHFLQSKEEANDGTICY